LDNETFEKLLWSEVMINYDTKRNRKKRLLKEKADVQSKAE